MAEHTHIVVFLRQTKRGFSGGYAPRANRPIYVCTSSTQNHVILQTRVTALRVRQIRCIRHKSTWQYHRGGAEPQGYRHANVPFDGTSHRIHAKQRSVEAVNSAHTTSQTHTTQLNYLQLWHVSGPTSNNGLVLTILCRLLGVNATCAQVLHGY
jgi:hypothetical protein